MDAGKENLAAALAAKARSQMPPLPEIHDVLRGANGDNLLVLLPSEGRGSRPTR